jgi:alpha-tubulin suppressor-like RCC1 family protein
VTRQRTAGIGALVIGASALLACSLLVDMSGLAGPAESDGGLAGDREGAGADGAAPAESGVAAGVLLAANGTHTCAVADGRASCWGSNNSGELGDGTRSPRFAPARVKGLPAGAVTAIGAGYRHSCAVVAGDVYCWGSADSGDLGPGASDDSTVPVRITGLPGAAVDVGAGGEFSCALVGQRVYCWGSNDHGRLGDGTTTRHSTPTAVVDGQGILEGVARMSVGGDHVCVVKTTGEPLCWGHSDGGALGNAPAGGESAVAVTVHGLPSAPTSVDIAGWHACAIVNGAAWCWGTGSGGMLGNGAEADSVSPVPVSDLGDDVTLLKTAGSSDYDATCAVRKGELWCWGYGKFFRLGNGDVASHSTPVKMTTLLAPVVTLAGGANHWCASLTNGEVRCWGHGAAGELGDGAGVDRPTPVLVSGL